MAPVTVNITKSTIYMAVGGPKPIAEKMLEAFNSEDVKSALAKHGVTVEIAIKGKGWE